MDATLHVPQSEGERRKAATFIRGTLIECKLRNDWLILQLGREGFRIQPSAVSDLLAGRIRYPKGDEFLARAERICKRYRQSWSTTRPSGN